MNTKTDYAKVGNEPQIIVPGDEKTVKQQVLETGANVIQSFAPIRQIHMHLCGFAFYKDDPKRQVELHHFTAALNDDVFQCAVYDGEGTKARLVGIEYVISEKLFNTLDADEKKYWHSHMYDIKSGSFIAPRIPNAIDHTLAQDLALTYGKTWILWQTDRGDRLPIGEPKLMMVATKDGEWDPKLFERREAKYGKPGYHEETRKLRADLKYPPPDANADWNQSLHPTFQS
jgi:hypothetical protein